MDVDFFYERRNDFIYWVLLDLQRSKAAAVKSCSEGPGGGWGTGTSKLISQGPLRSAPSIRNVECSNCKFLSENIKVLAGKIKVLEATLEMEMHLENDKLNSAALLHELYNEMGKLGDTCEGYIFITARVFLEGTPVMGTYGFHYCPSVLGGDTSDGYIVHRFHELSSNRKLDAWHTWYALKSKYFKNPFQNDSVRGRSLKADAMVMDAPTSPTHAGPSGEGHDDTVDIRVDRIHPAPVAVVVFPAATVVATLARLGEAIRGIREHLQGVPINEEMMALRFRVEIAEAENASLRGKIRTLEAMDTITRGQEKMARRRMEQQLALVTGTLREMQTKIGALQAQQARAPGPHSALEDADKMASKKSTRSTPATTTTTHSVTDAQLKALIDQGVAEALAARDAARSQNGNDSQNSGSNVRRNERVIRECTYLDFLKCQPLNFKGTEGMVGLMQWFERMETVYCIRNCSVENQIKFVTCTLLGSALTWWNSRVATVGHDNAYAMNWLTQKKKMTDKYCPRGEMRKLERLTRLKGMLEIRTFTERRAENKRKSDDTSRNNLPKRQNMAQAYTVGSGERKEYAGTLPLCNKYQFHHNCPCTAKCGNCKKVGHLTRDCWSSTTTNNQRIVTYYECGIQRHYRSDCIRLKNQNNGNQAGGSEAYAKVYALGGGETDQDLHDVEEDINA
ncbi:putative reverse transcriptase domain-containing protein [Tanacetum coccineum]